MASERDAVIDAAFSEYAASVYRLAFAVVREHQAAEDVVQDTFVRAYDRFSTFDQSRPIGPWLHAIAANLAIDQMRRVGLRRWVRLGGPREIAPGGLSEPAESDPAGRVLDTDAVGLLLDELPARSRAMLVLRHAYGYDDRSIAGLLGTSPGNVRTQISRAHRRLRLILEPPADGAGEHGRRPDGD